MAQRRRRYGVQNHNFHRVRARLCAGGGARDELAKRVIAEDAYAERAPLSLECPRGPPHERCKFGNEGRLHRAGDTVVLCPTWSAG